MAIALVTGGCGFLGRSVCAKLVQSGDFDKVIALDLRKDAALEEQGIECWEGDIRDESLGQRFAEAGVTHVAHLAAIVTPDERNREFEYQVDVVGTQNILKACVDAGVQRIVFSSSGAAYGYHADNADWLTEDMPVRGNKSFSYSWHKRLAEESFAEYRQSHPNLQQVIFRVGTILGESVDNQITNLFKKKKLLKLKGYDSPFVFIWDKDVAAIIAKGMTSDKPGIYNVAGDGALTVPQIARELGKPVRELPPALLRLVLRVAHGLRLSHYGPEQLKFIQYRPVLDNTALKEQFGYVPSKTSLEAFRAYRDANNP